MKTVKFQQMLQATLVALLFLFSTASFGGNITNVSWTSTSNKPFDTVNYTFTYTIATGNPTHILYMMMSYNYYNKPFNCEDATQPGDVKVEVNGSVKSATWLSYDNGLMVTLDNPSAATAGSTIKVSIKKVKNGSEGGKFPWVIQYGFFRTANLQGNAVDYVPQNVMTDLILPPFDPTGATASEDTICAGSPVVLTGEGVMGYISWRDATCDGTELYIWGYPYTFYPTVTTTYVARNWQNGAYSVGCAPSVKVVVAASPTAGTITKTPNLAKVCLGTLVSAAVTAGTGNPGVDTVQYRVSSSPDTWNMYTSGTQISTTGETFIEVRTFRWLKKCKSAVNTSRWDMYAVFAAGSIQSAGETVCYNGDPGNIAQSTLPTGGNLPYSYKWQKSLDAVFTTPIEIASSNSTAYNPPSGGITADTWFRRMAKDALCEADYSASANTWKVTILPLVTSGIAGGLTPICVNTSPGTFTATGGGGSGTYTYQWCSRKNSITTTVSGATAKTYNPGNLAATTAFFCLIKGGTCTYSVSSDTTLISVITGEVAPVAATITRLPAWSSVCAGTDVSATLSGGSGGNGIDSTYYRTKSGENWSGYLPYISTTAISTTGKTNVEIVTFRNGVYCGRSTYNTIRWVVSPATAGGTMAGGTGVCFGTNSTPLTLSGHTGSILTWQNTSDGTTWNSISATTSATYTAVNLTDTTSYRARIKSGVCPVQLSTSTVISGEVIPVSKTAAKFPNSDSVCEGTNVSATFTGGIGGNSTDSSYCRTKAGGTWSAWIPYSPGDFVLSTGKTDIEIKTFRKASICADAAPTTVSWIVSPTTVAGTASGGKTVCWGINSTNLTISGHTGTVLTWQYSLNGTTWNSISGSAGNPYTAVNLLETTTYRALVRSGVCTVKNSSTTKITVQKTFTISGYIKYENNVKTSLNGLKVMLRKDGAIVDSAITDNFGKYLFSNKLNGSYAISIKSAHPSGNWQTWGGVNNTDYMIALKHATTGPLLLNTPPVIRISGDVKAPQTPPLILENDANAIRWAAKYGWGSPPYFDIPKWVFSGINDTLGFGTFELNCANVTRDFRGICAGDVNCSFTPLSGYKTAETMDAMSLHLENRGTLPIMPSMIFPIRAESDMELGAITLMLDYDASLIQITGVEMPENGGVEPWFLVQSSKFKVAATLNLKPRTLNLKP